jgi:hypothetical protein
MLILEHKYLFFHIATKVVQALVIAGDEVFEVLMVKRDALLSKSRLGVGCDYDVIWKS